MTPVEPSSTSEFSLVLPASSEVDCVVFESSLPLSSFSLESDEESTDPEVPVDLLFSFDVSVLSVDVESFPDAVSGSFFDDDVILSLFVLLPFSSAFSVPLFAISRPLLTTSILKVAKRLLLRTPC